MLEMWRTSFTPGLSDGEHDEGNSHKVPILWDQLEAENQQEKSMEAERLGLERSK